MFCQVCKRDSVRLFRDRHLKIFCGKSCHNRFYGIGVHLVPMETINELAQQLHDEGYAVLQVYTEDEVRQMRDRFVALMESGMVEYQIDPATNKVPVFEGEIKHVGGGFGGLANPSSFHHPLIREMRRDAHRVASRLFKAYLGILFYVCFLFARGPGDFFSKKRLDIIGTGQKLEQIVDRARVLRRKAVVGAEAWHRDKTPRVLYNKMVGRNVIQEDDYIFGGWIALDGPQKFSGVKGTHRDKGAHDDDGTGFSVLSDEAKAQFSKDRDEAGEDWFIQIPPGYMLIFQQEMIHEVVGGSRVRPDQSYRLFTGWRLTTSDESMIPDDVEFFTKQGVPILKSAQDIVMYPSRPWSQSTASRTKLSTWSTTTFVPQVLETRTVASGVAKGESHQIVQRKMKSLQDNGLPLYPGYDNFDRQLLRPMRLL